MNYKIISSDDNVVEVKTWSNADAGYTLRVKNVCSGGVAYFDNKPEIPSDYSKEEGVNVLWIDGFDSFEYSSGQKSDDLIFDDDVPDDVREETAAVWSDSMESGLEENGWEESDTEVMFYGKLVIKKA
jgi:hypothetical protein